MPRWAKVGIGVVAVLALGSLVDDGETVGAQPAAQLAASQGGTSQSGAADPWPGGAEARAAAFAELAAMQTSSRHVEAIDRARELAREPYAAQWADSLHGVAEAAEEDALYERARRIPGSELERNRDAYAELARAYPASARLSLYTEKRDTYAQRIVDRDNARFRVRQAPRARSRSCCKRCSKGQPCGNSCISRSYTCRQPPGCAC